MGLFSCTISNTKHTKQKYSFFRKLNYTNQQRGFNGSMKIINRDKLVKCSKKHANVKLALDAWYAEVSSDKCCWKTTQDIKDRYPSADYLADNRVIFNIKGNHYRLVVKVRFQNGLVVVEWAGSHAEYDKIKF